MAPNAHAQPADPHTAQPERPSVATHAFTVAPGWLELEFGAARESSHGAWLDTNLPVNVKIGLASTLQLAVSTAPIHAAGTGGYATDSLGVALKWRIADDLPLVGSVAVLPSVQVPAVRGEASRTAGVVLISSMSARAVSLDLNVGFTHRGETMAGEWTSQMLWAAAGGGLIGGPVSWGAELFGYRDAFRDRTSERTVGALVSAMVAVRPWLAVDVSGTVPVSGEQLRVIQAGAVWNVGRIWRVRSGRAPAIRPAPVRGLRPEGL